MTDRPGTSRSVMTMAGVGVDTFGGSPATLPLPAEAGVTTGKVLVAYATKYGSTGEVAEEVAATLVKRGLHAQVRLAAGVKDITLYDFVVLGSALYFGRLHRDAVYFLHRYRDELAVLPVAVFAMGPRTLAPAELAESQRQLAQGLAAEPNLVPLSTEVFGGVVDPSTGSSLITMAASDARDWQAIRAWANAVASEFGAPI